MKPRPLIIKADHALVPLTKGEFAVIDLEDVELVNKWNWYCDTGYAVRKYRVNGEQFRVRMHRVINQTPEHLQTDHINLNKLDNRKSNLRNATASQNSRNQEKNTNNKTGYKGVSWVSKRKRFKASILARGKSKSLGYFKCPIKAAKAYDKKALEVFGEYAYLNFK